MSDKSEKVKQSHWDSLKLPEKTDLYFKKMGFNTSSQAMFWNNWKHAFQVFENVFVRPDFFFSK
jgi:hypothetical protein